MKSDKEAKIIALIIVIISIFFFYTSYNSKDMTNKLGFAAVGVWGTYIVFKSYIRQYMAKILRKGDMK